MEFYRGLRRGQRSGAGFSGPAKGILPEAPCSVKGRVADAEIELRPARTARAIKNRENTVFTVIIIMALMHAHSIDRLGSRAKGGRTPELGRSGGLEDRLKRNQTLDVSRGFLSWIVVMVHVVWLAGYHGIIQHNAGAYAVDGFIILSGFVIAQLLVTKNEPYGLYIFRRFMRLFPAFIVCLAIALLVRPFTFGTAPSELLREASENRLGEVSYSSAPSGQSNIQNPP
jgi:hypothetical protein